MMLDPLAEVGVGMLMPVMVRCSQFVVDCKRGRERPEDQQRDREDEADRPAEQTSHCARPGH